MYYAILGVVFLLILAHEAREANIVLEKPYGFQTAVALTSAFVFAILMAAYSHNYNVMEKALQDNNISVKLEGF